MWTHSKGSDRCSRRNILPSWTWAEWRGDLEYSLYINFHRGKCEVLGLDLAYTEVEIERQVVIDPDCLKQPAQQLRKFMEIREFILKLGKPLHLLSAHKVALSSKKGQLGRAESEINNWHRVSLGSKPRAEDYDYHLITTEGMVVHPQNALFDPFSEIHHPEIHLGSDATLRSNTCRFPLLAYVKGK